MTPDLEALTTLHDALARFWERVEGQASSLPERRWRLEFETALAEVTANVVKHARPPTAFELYLSATDAVVEAHLRDAGRPFDAERAAQERPSVDEWDDVDFLPEGGYGLVIARRALDTLAYERTPDGSNHWTLLKRWSRPPLGVEVSE